jgi:hypothetical protein
VTGQFSDTEESQAKDLISKLAARDLYQVLFLPAMKLEPTEYTEI